MTEQEKHELARQLKDNIEDLVAYLAAHPNSMDACDVRWRIKIGSIALASLIAPPVKLPKSERLDGNGYGYYFDMNDVFTALEEADIKFEVED